MNGETIENPSQGAEAPAPTDPTSERDRAAAPIKAGETPPPRKKPVPARRAALLIGAVLLAALAAAGVFLARRQPSREPGAGPDAARAEESAAPTLTLEPPEPAGTPLAGEGPAPAKIFNQAVDGVKAGAAAIGDAPPSAGGSITQLPPPPETGSGNQSLQDAAKDAARILAPKPQGAPEIDLSTDDAGSALWSLEREAAAQAAQDFAPPAVAHAGAGIGEALNLDIARLAVSLETERQHTERQTAEIARLNSELAALKAQGAPRVRMAKAALLFSVLRDRARSGAPYRREMDDYARAAGVGVSPAIVAGADAGLASVAALKDEFPGVRDAALAAARREAAKGPIARIGANLASLVRLRRAAAVGGPGSDAILSRAEAKLMGDDLEGALADLSGLTGGARKEASAWVEKTSARARADASLSDINRALIAALEAEAS